MAYTPVASDQTNPLDTVDRSTAAAEFRLMKTYINGISTVASSTTPDIFNGTNHVINYTGVALATGFIAAPQAGADRLISCIAASQFTAGANLIIDGVASGNTITVAVGTVLRVIALTTTQFRLISISPVATATYATSAGTATTATTAGSANSVANGSITASKLASAVAGNYLTSYPRLADIPTIDPPLNAPTKYLEQLIGKSGTYRTILKFNHNYANFPNNYYAQIYRNGGAVGTLRAAAIAAATSTEYYTEDIAGWTTGDLIQVYIYKDNGNVTPGMLVGLIVLEGAPLFATPPYTNAYPANAW